MSRRVAVIFGTRPEAIKMAPVILALRRQRGVECRVCVTAQHRQMLDQVLEVFDLVPDVDLDLMRQGQTLAELTARTLTAVDGYLAGDRPDLVLVQGDTTTVLCTALACFYRRVPVGHVEAGLRTWNLDAPWPEEANRVLTSRLAAMHFAPTRWSRDNLRREGVPARCIRVTGNPVVDALRLAQERIGTKPPRVAGLPDALQPGAGGPRVVLITGHRRESFGEGFEQICRAIVTLADRFPDVHFVYPVHLNPNVREPVFRLLGGQGVSGPANVHLIEPVAYLPFVALMERSHVVLTDSGGIQEEAPSLGKPVLIMRRTTERPEGVQAGTAKLVGTNVRTIVREVSRLLRDDAAYAAVVKRRNPYGDGCAAERIAKACVQFLDAKGNSLARPGKDRR